MFYERDVFFKGFTTYIRQGFGGEGDRRLAYGTNRVLRTHRENATACKIFSPVHTSSWGTDFKGGGGGRPCGILRSTIRASFVLCVYVCVRVCSLLSWHCVQSRNIFGSETNRSWSEEREQRHIPVAILFGTLLRSPALMRANHRQPHGSRRSLRRSKSRRPIPSIWQKYSHFR